MRGTNGIVQVLPGPAAHGKTPHGPWHRAAKAVSDQVFRVWAACSEVRGEAQPP